MIWWSGGLVAVAMSGVIGLQLYLWMRRIEPRRRLVAKRWMAACAGVAMIGYGLLAGDCVSSGACYRPQRLAKDADVGIPVQVVRAVKD